MCEACPPDANGNMVNHNKPHECPSCGCLMGAGSFCQCSHFDRMRALGGPPVIKHKSSWGRHRGFYGWAPWYERIVARYRLARVGAGLGVMNSVRMVIAAELRS